MIWHMTDTLPFTSTTQCGAAVTPLEMIFTLWTLNLKALQFSERSAKNILYVDFSNKHRHFLLILLI